MAVSGFSLSQGEQKISLEGRAEKDGRLKGRLAVGKLLLAPWLAGKRVPAQANLNARLEAEGTLQAPTFSLAGKVDGLVWRRFPPVEIVFRGGYRNGLLAFDGQALSENRVVFDLKASLGLRLGLRPFAWELIDPGVRAVALAQDFPLALLEPLAVGISGLRGSARLEFSAQGPWQDPQLKGRFELKQGAFNVDVLDQRFRGLNARLTLEGRKIAVEEIALENGGRAHIDGLIILPAPEDEGRLELNLVSQGITISLGPWGEVTTDADLALRGPFSRPSLTGALKPKAAKLLWGLAPPSDLKEVVVLNPGEQPPAFHKPGQPKVWAPGKGLEKASLDVSLDLASSLRINVGDGWLLLKGSPRVVKKPDGPLTYHNRIEITRGLILVSGKAFQVQRGMVDFADRDRPDPDLFGEASIRVGATQIFVAVSGQASNPNVQLTSQPPMSQTDILSTIIFGQPARNLSQDQSSALSAQAAALLGQAGAGEIRKIVGSELTPDVVTVHSEGQAGSSLEAGKYLSSDLYLRYRRRMTQEGGQNLGLEYRLRNWLSLESQVGDTRDTGVDVIFNLDF